MMNVNQVSFTAHQAKAAKKPLTKGQKAAIATTAVVGAAAVATVVASAITGKKVAPDAKFLGQISAGFGTITNKAGESLKTAGGWITDKAGKAGKFVKEQAGKVGEFFKGLFQSKKVQDAAQEVGETIAQ